MAWVRAAELAVLQRNGGVKRVTDPADPTRKILVILDEGGTLYAVANQCPHEGAELTAGYVHNGWIECPLHAWRFDLSSGERINSPANTRRDCLATYLTRVVNGVVEVDVASRS